MKITFFIDAAPNYLCNWLEDFTRNAPNNWFSTEKGRIALQRAITSIPGNRGSNIYMVMRGTLYLPKSANSETAYDIGDVIELKIIPLTPSRIEIEASCNQPIVTEYFLDLLTEINKRWPQTEDIVAELTRIRQVFEAGLAEIKAGQSAIYAKIGELDRQSLARILEAIQQGRIEQGDLQRTLDAIRRTLKYIQSVGVALNDVGVKKSLEDIYQSINNNLDLSQQVELSLPIIPFLLEYKLAISAGMDLEAVWKELVHCVRSENENE